MRLQLHKHDVNAENLEICLAGEANVLRKENTTVANDLVESVLEIAREKKLKIRARSLGGYKRRTVSLNIQKGFVIFTVGDSPEKVLCDFGTLTK